MIVIKYLLPVALLLCPLSSPGILAAAPGTAVVQNEEPAIPPELAKQLERANEKGDSRFLDEFMNMLLSLGMIIAFIMFFMWILKRMLNVRIQHVNQKSAVKILEQRQLTPKTTVYILGVFGKAVAIADSVNGVTLLSEFSAQQTKDFRAMQEAEEAAEKDSKKIQ